MPSSSAAGSISSTAGSLSEASIRGSATTVEVSVSDGDAEDMFAIDDDNFFIDESLTEEDIAALNLDSKTPKNTLSDGTFDLSVDEKLQSEDEQVSSKLSDSVRH